MVRSDKLGRELASFGHLGTHLCSVALKQANVSVVCKQLFHSCFPMGEKPQKPSFIGQQRTDVVTMLFRRAILPISILYVSLVTISEPVFSGKRTNELISRRLPFGVLVTIDNCIPPRNVPVASVSRLKLAIPKGSKCSDMPRREEVTEGGGGTRRLETAAGIGLPSH